MNKMAGKSAPSGSTLKTLNGLFQGSKINYRRDFLRENKLNLKELQRNTINKLSQSKQEQEKRQQSHLENNKKQRERYVARRSTSQQRVEVQLNDDNNCDKDCNKSLKRSLSQMREIRRPNNSNGNGHDPCNRMCKSPLSPHQPLNQYSQLNVNPTLEARNDTNSIVSMISKTESCDKEIQTEDITDETFLYEALKKCNSSDMKLKINEMKANTSDNASQQQKYDGYSLSQLDYNNYNNNYTEKPQIEQNDTKSEISYMPMDSKSQNNYVNEDSKSYHQNYQTAESVRSQYNVPINDDNRSQVSVKIPDAMSRHSLRTHCSDTVATDNMPKPSRQNNSIKEQDNQYNQLEENIQKLNIDQNVFNEPEVSHSVRSFQTIYSRQSINKKKSNESLHKVGDRNSVRLPRYLEKEKRDKELEREKELLRDPNCPFGHYLLHEDERVDKLNYAKKKMATLIQELNYMPMTMETLRIRNRKVEIERELTKIEADIRLYSKPKVYLPLPQDKY